MPQALLDIGHSRVDGGQSATEFCDILLAPFCDDDGAASSHEEAGQAPDAGTDLEYVPTGQRKIKSRKMLKARLVEFEGRPGVEGLHASTLRPRLRGDFAAPDAIGHTAAPDAIGHTQERYVMRVLTD